jgi:hypothetical protein
MFAYHTIQPQSYKIKKNKKDSFPSTPASFYDIESIEKISTISKSKSPDISKSNSCSPDISVSDIHVVPEPEPEPEPEIKKISPPPHSPIIEKPKGSLYKIASTKIYSNKIPQFVSVKSSFLSTISIRGLVTKTGLSVNEICFPISGLENYSDNTEITACNADVKTNPHFNISTVSKIGNNQIRIIYSNDGPISTATINVQISL